MHMTSYHSFVTSSKLIACRGFSVSAVILTGPYLIYCFVFNSAVYAETRSKMSRIRIAGKLPYLRFPPQYKGAPQRRIYFPDWYVRVVKPDVDMPKNYVKFHIPHDMTKYDVKEYLESIYSIPVAAVKIGDGTWTRNRDESGKWYFMEPFKIAHVTLGKGQLFSFPELIPKEKEDFELNPIESEEKRRKELKAFQRENSTADNSSELQKKLRSRIHWLE